jgi:hypothetical protein
MPDDDMRSQLTLEPTAAKADTQPGANLPGTVAPERVGPGGGTRDDPRWSTEHRVGRRVL